MSLEPPPHSLPLPTRRRSLWRLLPWLLLPVAAILLFFVLQMFPHLRVPHRAVAALPEPSRPVPSPAPVAVSITEQPGVPLMVTLYSTKNGRHVKVGTPALLSAYAALPPGGSATVAIAYRRNHGPQSLLALAQGSLSTAAWTPAAPGRYEFTASATDSRKSSVFSRRIVIYADGPPARALPPPQVAAAVPEAAPSSREEERRTFSRETHTPPETAPHSPAYHVAAAAFIVRPVAETLAGALRRRGFPAFVRPGPRMYRKRSYAVETGTFVRRAEAQKQVDTLKHDGYPAFVLR